jgi:hypothetical protein
MEKSCSQCSAHFEITEEDLEFYEKISPIFGGKKYLIPPPTLCPDCRQQRRLAWRNERKLYKRKCDASKKEIISIYNPEQPFPVYENEEWWKDSWDGKFFGKPFDFSRSFTEQFQEILQKVPKMARIQQGENENSQFTNCASWNKNCYLIFGSDNCEDCLYSKMILNSKDSCDDFVIIRSELTYECINGGDLYNSIFLLDCENTSDSWFCKHCIGCKHCFGSVNLHNKQYYFFNKQYSKEEYEEKIKALQIHKYSNLQKIKKEFSEHVKKFPQKFMLGIQNQDCSGDIVYYSKNSKYCFDAEYLEDCKFCTDVVQLKNSYDVSFYGSKGTNELLYDTEGSGHGVFHVSFSKLIWGGSSEIYYSYECFNSHHLFGCTGLKKNSYCILNKQYSKEEYETLVPKIIEHMQNPSTSSGNTPEWGEFFPVEISPFAYNETVAQEYFPLEKEDVGTNSNSHFRKNWKWRDEENTVSDFQKIIPAERLPERIQEIPDDILNWAIKCERSGRLFKIQKPELEFYRKMNLPIPHLHPDERHKQRMSLRNPRKLWKRKCDNCGVEIETSYSPDRPEKVFCEKCYLEAVV